MFERYLIFPLLSALLAGSVSANDIAVCDFRANLAMTIARAREKGVSALEVARTLDAAKNEDLLLVVGAIYSGRQPDPLTLHRETMSICLDQIPIDR